MKTYDPTVCVYDGRPAATVRTGQQGNRFGLCAECAPAHERSLVAEQAITELENFRTAMLGLGQLSPKVEKFIDHMVVLVTVTEDPRQTLDTVFRVLAAEPAEARS